MMIITFDKSIYYAMSFYMFLHVLTIFVLARTPGKRNYYDFREEKLRLAEVTKLVLDHTAELGFEESQSGSNSPYYCCLHRLQSLIASLI